MGGSIGEKKSICQVVTALQVSLVMRQFTFMETHQVASFYWYLAGALSIAVFELLDRVVLNAAEYVERRSKKAGALSMRIPLARAPQIRSVD
jgi:hypothetical protein